MRRMDPKVVSDEELVARYQAVGVPAEGEQYVNELFGRHYVRVARWCLRFTGDRDTAADLAQEIFMNAYRRLGSFEGRSKFSTWLYSITNNQCINAIKARSINPVETGDAVLVELPDGGDPYAMMERESSAESVRRLLNETLDETERIVFTLHYGQDLPLETITRLLGLENSSGAKAYIVSAKRKLSRSVQRWKACEQGRVR